MRKLIRRTLDRLPYVGALREQVRNAGPFPAGTFLYRSIPARAEINTRLQALNQPVDDLPGINLNVQGQSSNFSKKKSNNHGDLPFPEERTVDCRYYFRQTAFCYADAIFLYSFLRLVQPKKKNY